MNLPHLGVLSSEPVRAGVLPLGGAGLGEASACGKRPSTQPALGPTLAGGRQLPHVRWRAGERVRKTRAPQCVGGPWHSRCFHRTVYSLFLASAVALSSSSLSLPLHLAELLSTKATSPGSLPWLLWALHTQGGPSPQEAMSPVHPLSSFPRLWAGVASFAS